MTKNDSASAAVRRAIAESGLSLNELSRRTGVDVATLSRFMKEKDRSVTLTTLELLADELGLSVMTPLYVGVVSTWDSPSLGRVLEFRWNTKAGAGSFELNRKGLLPGLIETIEADGLGVVKVTGNTRAGEPTEMEVYDVEEETLIKDLEKLLDKKSQDPPCHVRLRVRSLTPEQLVERFEEWKASAPPLKRRVVTR
jgi:transcriptional regulator with XRE-family HTH domain